MKKVSFDTYRKNTSPQRTKNSPTYDTVQKNRQLAEKNALKGILLNNYIKDDKKEEFDNFESISTQLLIPQNIMMPQEKTEDETKSAFDFKKAMKPLVLLTGFTLAAITGISIAMQKYSKIMATEAGTVIPGDLARNINIVEEPHFAMYRALRDPNAKNIFGFIGVGIFTGATICAKSFVDGAKEIWIKKQNCDIEHDLQKNLIEVETEAFSGKLNVVNTLLSDSMNYFKSVLGKKGDKNTNFQKFLSFKGKEEKNPEESKDNKRIKTTLAFLGATAGICGILFLLFKNYQKTAGNLENFYRKFEDKKIRADIEKAVSKDNKENAIKTLSDILKSINAKEETMRTNLGKIKGITEEEIAQTIKSIKQQQIYAQAPEALGGISEKIQYYCYINEERGHLYNWILNPENKFNEYLFLSFCAISATGYLARAAADAIKNVAVGRENSKSELALRKQLVKVEIDNFKAKKMSAINPMLENFSLQAQKGKSKEELKELAESILTEIKNGPPYVYS